MTERIAMRIMRGAGGDDATARAFAQTMLFLEKNPDMITRRRNSETVTEAFMKRKAPGFLKGRRGKAPAPPDTAPDPFVRFILENAFNVPADQLDAAEVFHAQAMAAENYIGWALEAYIASIAEESGWAWCSGQIVKYVDFIKPHGDDWLMLQVKNRNNTENSASSSVRDGTEIQIWFRTFSNGGTNWEAFPDEGLRARLSEEGFKSFIVEKLAN